MLFEWFAREGGVIVSWWLLVSLAGAAAVPLALRLLGGLPDRGFTLARPLGLLLVGFTFWLLTIFGFIRNDTGGMALAYVVVAIIGLAAYFSGRGRIDLRLWWKTHRGAILVNELVFLLALVVWTIYKAYVNDAFTTEKPMELAFMSGVMRSDAFPPNDPWFAGYAISYYYLGYVIGAMLSTLSGVSSGVGFSMLHALLFALTASSVFGVVYNLVRSRANDPDPSEPAVGTPLGASVEPSVNPRPRSGVAIGIGLLGVVFVLLLSNFVLPLVEVPYQNGADASYLAIWNMNERQQPQEILPGRDASLDNWGYWWWFRAARAISDRGLDGNHSEVIDEFPAFSFILSDNHPHVLSLPFAAMAIGLALNIVLTRRRPNVQETVLYGLVIGGLIFMNTWDGAIYLIAFVGAEGIRRLLYGGSGRLQRPDWTGMVSFGAAMLVIGVVAVFPFLISFRSQLNGILPNLINPTGFSQFFLQFAPFLILLLPFLLVEVWRGRDRTNWSLGVTIGITVLLLLALLLVLFALLGTLIPGAMDLMGAVIQQNGGMPSALIALLSKRLTHLPTSLILTLMLVLVAARLFPRQPAIGEDDDQEGKPRDRRVVTYPPATGFALLLIAVGAALVLAPEFVYLRDNFGTRMNTVFKFYYQGWLVWGVASAYAVYSLLAEVRLPVPSPAVKAAYSALLAVVLIAGLPYIVMAVYHRAFIESGRSFNAIEVTLDGAQSYVLRGGTSPNDLAALACLSDMVGDDEALVVQAPGNSYNGQFGIVGTLEGIPILFNWYGHQGQWRGDALGSMVGSRLGDIEQIYADPTWHTTQEILARYGIDYIFVGEAERREYTDRLVNAEYKFRDNLDVVCEFGNTRVYRVPERALATAR